MTAIGPDTLLATFVLFCRIGACLMLMPGISSQRIPTQIRLFLAFAVTLALTPMLLGRVTPALADPSVGVLGRLIATETLIGVMIGLLGRVFFMALQALGSVLAMVIGYGNMPGSPVDDTEPMPALVTLITLTATILLFLTEQHWEILRGLAASYATLPPADGYGAQFGLMQLADRLADTFFLALRITSPFIIYAVLVNLAVGITNKLTPQIPVYFISLPFVVAGGFFLLYFTLDEVLRLFMDGFGAWIAGG